MKKILLIILLLKSISSSVIAANFTASSDGNWSNSATWTPAGVPGMNDNVTIPNGITVTLDADQDIQNLTIQNGGTLLFDINNVILHIHNGGTVSVSGSLTVSGVVSGTGLSYVSAGQSYQISGGGDIEPENIYFDAIGVSLLNSADNLNIRSDINVRQNSCSFTNDDAVSIGNKLTVAAGVTDFVFTNNSGDTFTAGQGLNIEHGCTNTVFNNKGTANIHHEILCSTAGTLWNNLSGSALFLYTTATTANFLLDCDVNGQNTVNYRLNTGADQLIFSPLDHYYHLTLSGNANKITQSDLVIKGDLKIVENSTLDVSVNNNTLEIYEDWINNRGSAGFTEGTSKVIFAGKGQVINSAGSGEVFYDLEIRQGASWAGVQLQNDTKVLNHLHLEAGMLQLNQNTLSIDNPVPSAITRNSGTIVSEQTSGQAIVKWKINDQVQNYTIPFATYGSNYIPFHLNITQNDIHSKEFSIATYPASGSVQPWPAGVTNLASSAGLSPDNRAATVQRFWITDLTAGTIKADITFNYTSNDLPDAPYNDPAQIRSQRYNSNTDEWEAALPGQTANAYSVVTPEVSEFGPWALASTLSPLPVTLSSFTATRNNDAILLQWTTATELNSSHFNVERSYDGENFETIATILAANANHSLYEYRDYHSFKQISYYRLKQVDLDESFEYSSVIKVKSIDEEIALSVYPNPFTESFCIQTFINHQAGEEIHLTLYSVSGEQVYEQSFTVSEESFFINLENKNLTQGMYILYIRNEDHSLDRKIVLHKV